LKSELVVTLDISHTYSTWVAAYSQTINNRGKDFLTLFSRRPIIIRRKSNISGSKMLAAFPTPEDLTGVRVSRGQ
jgi:hypothetical protein